MSEVSEQGDAARRRLVIVESPGQGQDDPGLPRAGLHVEASVGHIRDLPDPRRRHPRRSTRGSRGRGSASTSRTTSSRSTWSTRTSSGKVAELKKALKDADELLLATDEDREGEAIAWHLLEVLKPKVPVRRMVFHEITRDAIRRRARRTPASSTSDLVDAQETRRILDRLYGYEVVPVLWKKVMPGLSAGRVQSVATRLVVERERERIAFRRPRRTGTSQAAPARPRPARSAPGWSRSTARGSPPGATSATTAGCRRPCDGGRTSTRPAPTALAAGARRARRSRSARSTEKPYRRRPRRRS